MEQIKLQYSSFQQYQAVIQIQAINSTFVTPLICSKDSGISEKYSPYMLYPYFATC